jgi:hypothetical protein
MKLKEYLVKAWENAPASRRTAKLRDWLHDRTKLDAADWYAPIDKPESIYHIDELTRCERCEELYYNTDDFREVTVRHGRTQYWCGSCVDNYAFYCDSAEDYYDSDDYNCVEYNGSYYEEGNLPDSYYDDGSDSGGDSYGRHDYHDLERDWVTQDDNADLFGVELEMRGTSGDNLRHICSVASDLEFLPERDGSLSQDYSVEIVAPPMPLKKFRNGDWKTFLDAVRGKAQGWDCGTGYGIHISIGRHNITALQQAMFIRFFSTGDNQAFCEKIAGRRHNTWAAYNEHHPWKLATRDGLGTTRYAAAAIRGRDRIEVRIFRSTLKFSSFLKNVQFVAALLEFVRHTSVSLLGKHCFKAFITEPRRCNRYRELIQFIKQKNL